ncbi:MAG: ArgR family transcriptional regulator [Treponema sp.]|nr:ArgR family transcriptional regulator [Treponema sp.]
MKERSDRLKAIKKLIKNNRIESQDELLKELIKEGFDVTQATLSRDLKLLKVGKVSDGNAGYVYMLQSDEDRGESEMIFVQDFLRGYVSIDWNATTVVIKTFGGHADAVANALDCLNLDEILGTVAGDSCVFAALRAGVSGEDFMKTLKKHIPDLEEDL